MVFFQIFTILASHGNVYLLGEAYAFGVIWSFTFNSLAMLVLRFKYKGRTRLEGSAQYHTSAAAKFLWDWPRFSWCCFLPQS